MIFLVLPTLSKLPTNKKELYKVNQQFFVFLVCFLLEVVFFPIFIVEKKKLSCHSTKVQDQAWAKRSGTSWISWTLARPAHPVLEASSVKPWPSKICSPRSTTWWWWNMYTPINPLGDVEKTTTLQGLPLAFLNTKDVFFECTWRCFFWGDGNLCKNETKDAIDIHSWGINRCNRDEKKRPKRFVISHLPKVCQNCWAKVASGFFLICPSSLRSTKEC